MQAAGMYGAGEMGQRGQQMQAAGMAPMLQQMGGYRAGLLGQAGQADIARQQRQQSYPWEQLAQYRGAVTGAMAPPPPGYGIQQPEEASSNPLLTGIMGYGATGNPWLGLGAGMYDYFNR